ncbi:MAG: conserved repeat protein [Candidatus Eremiobacteraeota bacterium]|nr:conserved repeat protein [Candidatus Eremiobacteraeota bacterium]
MPTTRAAAVATTPSFAVPAKPSFAVPRRPSFATPAKPSTTGRPPVASTPHAGFFAGEAALSNGVYYLRLPNGNPFGYYSYLPDPNYIYHFDAGYEYAIDANDGQGGVYLYDFASSHWWYTSRSFPFPYVYDFTLNALLYYYPDPAYAGDHYTSTPRYFYNFGTNQIITLPEGPPAAGTAQNVYVGDFDPNANGGPSHIFEFPGSAHGAVTPSRTIVTTYNTEKLDFLLRPDGWFFAGGMLFAPNSTQLGGAGAVARDKNNGHLYLAANSQITEYSADASQVLRRIPLTDPFIRTQAMAVDSSGNVFVGDSGTHEIDVYPPGATTPSRHLGNVQGSRIYYPYALAFDSHDNLFDADDGTVYMFTPGSNGASASGGAGCSTGLAVSLAIDEKDDIYVGCQGYPGGPGPSITVVPGAGQNARQSTLDLTGVVKYPTSIAIGP